MKVRYFFDFVSPYSYLAYHGLPPVTARHGVDLEAVPVLFAALLNHHGQMGPAEIPAKRLYIFKDVLRTATKLGLPLEPPPSHPFNPLGALRLCSLDMSEETRWKLVGRIFELVWGGGSGVSAETLAKVAGEFGIEDALDRIQRHEVKERLKAATQSAIESGVFGVPSMLVDGELFWGYDSLGHLEDYLAGTNPLRDDLVEMWQRVKPSAQR